MPFLDEASKDTGRLGTVNELIATIWLLNQGYFVFSSAMPHGPADLVAWKPETKEILMIDVKTVRRYLKKDGTVENYSSAAKTKRKEGVVYLGVCSEDKSCIWL